MPGAFLKGNSSFPGSSFVVDEISRPWNPDGAASAEIINRDDFTADSRCTVEYYRLKNIVSLHVDALLKPSSLPYTGVEDDTSYIYTGNFAFSEVSTTARVRLDGRLAAAPYHYENSVSVEDFKTGVFFDTSLSPALGRVHVNGIEDTTELVLTVPGGLLPNHEYRARGTIIYETL